MNEKISVIMSVYKEPIAWIKQCVDSVLAQTYTNFEFIIICDNPDYKEAIAVLQEYKDNDDRFFIYINEKNIGLTKSLNVALSLVSGHYIARMDADDICEKTRFEKQVALLNKRIDIDICSTLLDEIGENGNYIRCRECIEEPLKEFYIKNPIAHSTVMFRHGLLKKRNPLYNEEYRSTQDYELWAFLISNGCKFYVIQEVLLHYRISSQQITKVLSGNQHINHRTVRKYLIDNYLVEKKIVEAAQIGDIPSMISRISSSMEKQDYLSQGVLYYILFSLYYTLTIYSPIKFYKVLFDKNGFLFKIPMKMAAQVMLTLFRKSPYLGY